jgi:hypothetical protein|tara:strand:- start:5585 stop:5998 length:414 start_codon:yes stop_codon:yes gene_type:complete
VKLERFIFNGDASELFYEKLDSLHDNWVYYLLLNGVADKGENLESIKMTKSPKVSKKYVERVVGGLVNVNPEIIYKLVEDGDTRIECIFTRLNNDKEILNSLFMIQNVMDYPVQNKFSCQVWYLGGTTTGQIKEHLS